LYTGLRMRNTYKNTTSPFASREESTISQIETMFNNIIEWNNNLEVPIIISLKSNALRKIIRCFFCASKHPVALGFAGETASGKTTIANEIISSLRNYAIEEEISNFITKINMDNYYYDRSAEVIAAGSFDKFVENYDLDSPTAFELDLFAKHLAQLKNGQSVMLPEYDMSGTAKRWDDKIHAEPSQIVVTEGLYTFTEAVENCFDIKFYVDIDEDVQKARWYRRAKERDLGASADRVYNNALSKAKIYIRPTKASADVILNGEASIDSYKIFINMIIDTLRKVRNVKADNRLELVRS